MRPSTRLGGGDGPEPVRGTGGLIPPGLTDRFQKMMQIAPADAPKSWFWRQNRPRNIRGHLGRIWAPGGPGGGRDSNPRPLGSESRVLDHWAPGGHFPWGIVPQGNHPPGRHPLGNRPPEVPGERPPGGSSPRGSPPGRDPWGWSPQGIIPWERPRGGSLPSQRACSPGKDPPGDRPLGNRPLGDRPPGESGGGEGRYHGGGVPPPLVGHPPPMVFAPSPIDLLGGTKSKQVMTTQASMNVHLIHGLGTWSLAMAAGHGSWPRTLATAHGHGR